MFFCECYFVISLKTEILMRWESSLPFLLELYPIFQKAWQYLKDYFFFSISLKTLKNTPLQIGLVLKSCPYAQLL